jgi:hypothetical protein
MRIKMKKKEAKSEKEKKAKGATNTAVLLTYAPKRETAQATEKACPSNPSPSPRL